MEINSTHFKHCDLIHLSGRVDSDTAPKLAEVLESIMAANRYKIVLDLGAVNFMSSAGLRVLINTQKNCKRLNRGEVALAAIPSNILAALNLAGFIPLFKIFPDATAAVGSF